MAYYVLMCRQETAHSLIQSSKWMECDLLEFILFAYYVITRYGDSVDNTVNTVEENSSVFSLIRMRWLPSARASGQ